MIGANRKYAIAHCQRASRTGLVDPTAGHSYEMTFSLSRQEGLTRISCSRNQQSGRLHKRRTRAQRNRIRALIMWPSLWDQPPMLTLKCGVNLVMLGQILKRPFKHRKVRFLWGAMHWCQQCGLLNTRRIKYRVGIEVRLLGIE